MSEEVKGNMIISAEVMVKITNIVNQLAHNLHNWYEEAAKEEGWKTQDSCQVPYDQLPEANRNVMFKVAAKALSWCAKLHTQATNRCGGQVI